MTSNAQPTFAWHARKCHCAGYLSGGGETPKLAARAPCRAGCGRSARDRVVLHPRGGLSLLVQERGATCELCPPTCSRHSRGMRASATAVAVSRESAKHASLPLARRAALFEIGLFTMGGHYTGTRPRSFCARPWCDVRALPSNVQPAFAWHANKRHCASCLSRGGETRELAARARCAALTAVGLCTTKNTAPAEGLSLLRCKTVV